VKDAAVASVAAATSSTTEAEKDEVAEAGLKPEEMKPATPAGIFGSRPATPAASTPTSPFGSRPASPFGAKPAEPVKPSDTDDDADMDDDEGEDVKDAATKEDDIKPEEMKPATPAGIFGNRPASPFGARPDSGPKPVPKPGSASPFGAKPAASTDDDAEDDLDDDIDDETTDDLDDEAVKPATPSGAFGSRPTSPFGAKPTTPSGSSTGVPASPFGSRPVGAGTSSTTGGSGTGSSTPASPFGARPAAASTNPSSAPSSPFGSRPTSPFGTPKPAETAKPVDDEIDNIDDDDIDEVKAEATGASPATSTTDVNPEENKPVTPAASATPSSPFGAGPRPHLATTPTFDEDEDEDNDKNQKSAKFADNDDDDLPRSDGPRPTVSGGLDNRPANMPKPADPIQARTRPGQEGNGSPFSGAPSSPFGARPASAPPSEPTKPMPAVSSPAASGDGTPPIKSNIPVPVHSTEGTIVSSRSHLSDGRIPDYTQLLESGSEQRVNEQALQERARIIEETLEAFSAPGKVVEINTGPVITQFGVEPDYLVTRQGKQIRIKVGQIAKLDADLALALSARSIRIEAPVPGKGYIGIEVPNTETALVSLRDIMDSEEFQKVQAKSKLAIGLGQSVDGAPIAADMTQMPHLLIAGTTGSGKSVCVNAIIACLLLQNSPDDLKFIMVDPKRVELTGYNGIPHLVSPVVVDLERIVGVLKWVTREMDERYKKFAAISARNIVDYNNKKAAMEPRLPYLVVVIDELADLMMLAPEETEKVLTRLAQMARATGIHLIVSTQRPSVDVVTGLIKANFPARISFAVASSVDSRVILDSPGAEKLLGRGDMLFQAPDAAAPLRMQGVYLSDTEINRITGFWKGQKFDPPAGSKPASALGSTVDFNRPADPVQSRSERFSSGSGSSSSSSNSGQSDSQRLFGNVPLSTPISRPSVITGSGASDGAPEEDEMYDEALELVERAGKPSIQMLQRRLRIGYTRAARLIELMEKKGAISSADARSASTNTDPDSGE
jgi:DNA segregation ATPase FtsK/SpoIIIE-like protein